MLGEMAATLGRRKRGGDKNTGPWTRMSDEWGWHGVDDPPLDVWIDPEALRAFAQGVSRSSSPRRREALMILVENGLLQEVEPDPVAGDDVALLSGRDRVALAGLVPSPLDAMSAAARAARYGREWKIESAKRRSRARRFRGS